MLFHCLPSENVPEESEISLNCLPVFVFVSRGLWRWGEKWSDSDLFLFLLVDDVESFFLFFFDVT